MGFDNDCILNISSLAGEYFCPVCHLLVYPNEALQAPCTHLYCKPCLTYVVSTTHACPYDGYRVTEADCKPLLESNKSLADTIGKIQVHCLYYRTGCTWQGPLSDCTSHYSTCSYGESPVLCNRCGVQIVHRQVQEHAQNCPGVQPQAQAAQQPSTAQDSTSTGAVSAADQSQTVVQTGLPASQAQTSQASAALVSGQDANQATNTGVQPQAAQATMPTAEQWYQQQQQYQQQYQQYYQQYPGYDPYQQNYQYYYQYQQGVQPYPQQLMQGYPPQAYGQAQAQPQVSGQAQTQSQVQGQQQVQPLAQPQPQQQPQAQSQTAQPLPQPAQPAANAQPQAQSVSQGQSHLQAQAQVLPSHALPYNQTQPLPQAQPYAHTQPQQQMQVPQYQQTHPQAQHPPAQTYPPSQTQTQHYPYPQPQSQVQPQPHSQPAVQAPARPPSQQNQPINPNAPLQTHNSVTGYQSYPQPHLQAQVGAPHPMNAPGAQPQPQYPAQVPGKFPSQPSQMYPPQPYANVANQQQPTMSAAQGQLPSGPIAQQAPAYPNAQQPGYPFQQRTGAVQQAAPQHYGQQQSFPGQGPFTPPQPTMPGQLHAQAPPQTMQQPQQNYAPGYGAQTNIAQNYSARPVSAQAAGHQPYAQSAGYSGTGQAAQARPPMQNQSYPIRPDNQLAAVSEQQAGFPQQTSRATGGDKPRDQMLDKSIHEQNDTKKEVRDLAGASGAGVQVNDINLKSENSLDVSVNGNDSRVPGTGSKLLERDVQERKPRMKGDVSEGVSEPSPGSNAAKNGSDDHKDARKKAEVQDSKHTANSTTGAAAPASNLPQSHLGPQAQGTNSFSSIDQARNQPQPMHYGPSGQYRPGAVPMPQPPHHPYNSQRPALGHPPGQLRPQGPGQIPPRPPFNAAENSQPPIPKHLPGAIPHENVSGASLGPGSSGPFARPGNLGYYQGPPFAAQRPGEFDSHIGTEGRERADVEQRPYPMESEKYQAQRPGYYDGRKPEFSHGMERGSYGPAHQPGAMRFGGPSAHDAVSGMRDERVKSFPEENLKPFPQRDFEDDLRKFPRSSHFDAGPSSKYGNQFPSSGPLDHGPQIFGGDGMARPFEKSHHGFDRDGSKMDPGAGSGPSRFLPPFHPNDVGERGRAAGFPDDNMRRDDFGHRADFSGTAPVTGFGRSRMDGLPPRSPGRDFSGFPPRAYGDGGNETRPFEGSRPYNFPVEPFGKSVHENRFPVPNNHLQRGEHDVPGNMRMGEHFVGGPRNQDMLPTHLRRGEHMGQRNLHMGEATAFGPPGGLQRMGEPPLAGNFPQHLPFGDAFEKPGHPLAGEPGFRGGPGFQRYAREGGFYPEEMEPFDNPRKRKPGSIMCRICKVECGTVDGLELHSQSREHQRKARDMVLSIKQQNKKKPKISKGQAFVEGRDGGRPKNSNFQGRGNKR